MLIVHSTLKPRNGKCRALSPMGLSRRVVLCLGLAWPHGPISPDAEASCEAVPRGQIHWNLRDVFRTCCHLLSFEHRALQWDRSNLQRHTFMHKYLFSEFVFT